MTELLSELLDIQDVHGANSSAGHHLFVILPKIIAALQQCESDKNWLRAQRDIAEERLKSDTNQGQPT